MTAELQTRALDIESGREFKGRRASYSIGEYVGQGGSGVVYDAVETETGRTVAVKFFLPIHQIAQLSLLDTGGTTAISFMREIENFQRKELECLQALDHPNIVGVLDQGDFRPLKRHLPRELAGLEDIPFLITQFIHGRNLRKYVENGISIGELASILKQVSSALCYLHDKKQYLHADIRPENIIVAQKS